MKTKNFFALLLIMTAMIWLFAFVIKPSLMALAMTGLLASTAHFLTKDNL